jgi:putative transposase
MPRVGRRFEQGRVYHVYNRVGGAWMPFDDERLSQVFIDLLRQVVNRDGLVILGWCLLGNHFHLVIRQGPVDLSRPMKTLQQGVTRARNLRDRVYGPLWKGRFKAKLVTDPSYLMQVIAYVHLNPVKAGLTENAEKYRWSGHLDIIGRRRSPIVAIDDVLALFGETRRRALKTYRSSIEGVNKEDWSEKEPGRLPWWRLGRPTEDDRLRMQKGALDQSGRSAARWRPAYAAKDWVSLACAELDVDRERLAGRGRDPDVVRARELLGLVGIERYRVNVGELARELRKSRGGVTQWYRRGSKRRAKEPEFAAAADRLDKAASEDP